MIQLINIPTKSVDEAWRVVRTDIANALTRSNGYALSENIKKWIMKKRCSSGFFGIKKLTKKSITELL